jgi:hypothetical protein
MRTMTTPSPIRLSHRWRSLALGLLAVGAMIGPALLSSGPAAAEGKPPIIRESHANTAPTPTNCKVIDFRTATVEPLVAVPSASMYRLTVTGLLPAPADVSLVPLIYVRQPKHWGIEVVACPAPGIATPSLAGDPVAPPVRLFRATLDFRGPFGTCGIEVIGATRHQTFDLADPPACRRVPLRIQ